VVAVIVFECASLVSASADHNFPKSIRPKEIRFAKVSSRFSTYAMLHPLTLLLSQRKGALNEFNTCLSTV